MQVKSSQQPHPSIPKPMTKRETAPDDPKPRKEGGKKERERQPPTDLVPIGHGIAIELDLSVGKLAEELLHLLLFVELKVLVFPQSLFRERVGGLDGRGDGFLELSGD
jgi:hypothetical protein